jgi:hypothetical protein
LTHVVLLFTVVESLKLEEIWSENIFISRSHPSTCKPVL